MDDFSPSELADIESRTQEVGQYLFSHLSSGSASMFQRRWWDQQLLNWSMRNEDLKTQLFRFVDVLPMLSERDAVVAHLHEYLQSVRAHLPLPLRMALRASRWTSLSRSAISKIVRLATEDLATRFIAGTNTAEVLNAAARERRAKRAFTLDILGEAVISDREADQFCQAYINLIDGVAPVVNEWPELPLLDRDDTGLLPRCNVSVKLSALDSQFDAIDPEGTSRRVSSRLRELLRVARQHQAFINIDMESYDKKDLTFHIFRSVMMEPEFRDWSDIGIVVQCYLRDAQKDLEELLRWTQSRGAPVWVRLVKGAYWDYETIHARANGWPIPVFQRKSQTDAAFERATRFVMRNHRYLRPALGSHNLRSIAHGIAVAAHVEVPANGFEIQMLYGMADGEKDAVVELGHRMRIYMPYGELIPGMAYLVRRLLENTSNNSFLRVGFVEHRPVAELMRDPRLSAVSESELFTATRVDESEQEAV